MKLSHIIMLSAIVFIASCGEEQTEQEEVVTNEVAEQEFETNYEDSPLGADLDACISVHNQVYPVEIPFKANFTFGEYEGYFPLTDEEKTAFSLNEAGIDCKAHIFLEGFAELSEDYLAYVFVVETSENELSTYMLTYELDYSFVDVLRIGYDEVAEGFIYHESEVTKDFITLKEYTYFENEEMKERYFEITTEGKITEVEKG